MPKSEVELYLYLGPCTHNFKWIMNLNIPTKTIKFSKKKKELGAREMA